LFPCSFFALQTPEICFRCTQNAYVSIYNRDVFPHLFHIGSFAVPTYGFLAAIGMISGLSVIFSLARFRGLDPDQMWNLGGIAAFSGILGSKLLMILVDWRDYLAEPSRIFSLATLQSGGVFSGGLVLAIFCSWWYVRRERIPFLSAADVFAPGVALGHAFGRIGCLAAGCCFGRETHLPWAITFHNPWAAEFSGTPLDRPLHPTQLYEAVAELINFAFLYWLCKRKKFEGQVIALFMIVYGIERYIFEFFRGDPGRGEVLGGLMTGTQLIALGLVVSGFIIYLRRTPLRSLKTSTPKTHKSGTPTTSRA
jgi:phosphatidylglycerol:prolipoprotein diacylglycerol transferase